jgi:predicted DNA-binding transcriptional regulator AlpA
MRKRRRPPKAVLSRVLTVRAWAELNALGLRTARRMIADGRGPRIIQLTSRRVGVREVDAAAWQASHLLED